MCLSIALTLCVLHSFEHRHTLFYAMLEQQQELSLVLHDCELLRLLFSECC